jgi:hypothetical protein
MQKYTADSSEVIPSSSFTIINDIKFLKNQYMGRIKIFQTTWFLTAVSVSLLHKPDINILTLFSSNVKAAWDQLD